MSSPALPWLVADIGGTHARFALSEAGGAPYAQQVLETARFAAPEEAIDAYLRAAGARVDAACLAVAGPVGGDAFGFTNIPWSLSVEALRRRFGWRLLVLENDFAALARALPALDAGDLRSLGPERPGVPGATRAVLGPGTGLGVALLAGTPAGYHALPGEGGHAGFAPRDAREDQVLAALRRRHGRVCNETVLSGAGLATLFAALCEVDGVPVRAPEPAAVTAAALRGDDARAREVLDLFCAILGAVAATSPSRAGRAAASTSAAALRHGWPTSSPRRVFREAFEDKGAQRAYVAAIPTWLITAAAPALLGAALALRARLE